MPTLSPLRPKSSTADPGRNRNRIRKGWIGKRQIKLTVLTGKCKSGCGVHLQLGVAITMDYEEEEGGDVGFEGGQSSLHDIGLGIPDLATVTNRLVA
jgi:hypothetical protein